MSSARRSSWYQYPSRRSMTAMPDDEENGGMMIAYSDGYPAIEKFIASDVDGETFVFRKFSKLSAKVLLKQQAELIELEHELAGVEGDARRSGDWQYEIASRSLREMKQLSVQNEYAKRHIVLTDQIEVALQKYQESILRQAEIVKLHQPEKRITSAFSRTLHGKPGGEKEACKLAGQDATILDNVTDLVALKTPTQQDPLSRLIRAYWPFRSLAQEGNELHWHFEDRSVLLVASIINTIIAALLLVGSILCLYFVTAPELRLGLMLAFVVLFALGVSVCTSASRDSIFAASAAYAAVLVVFVSGNLGNTNTPG